MVRNIHKKGPIDVCSNSGGILTSSCVGKVYGRALRRRLLPPALNYAADAQCGGFPGKSPEFASQCARLFAARCKTRGWSHATVFLDATSAFYSLMRQWVLGFNETEDCLRQLCARIGTPNAEEMISMASRNPILFDAGASGGSVALARDWDTGNWISVEHVDEKRFCAMGTRPGDVSADLCVQRCDVLGYSPKPDRRCPSTTCPRPPVLFHSLFWMTLLLSRAPTFLLWTILPCWLPLHLLDNVRRHVRACSELLAVFEHVPWED